MPFNQEIDVVYHHFTAAFAAFVVGFICSTPNPAFAGPYATCRPDSADIVRERDTAVLLAERDGKLVWKQRVAELDRALYDLCLCQQVEWDRLKTDYDAALVEATANQRPLPLPPFELGFERPECSVPVERTWPEPESKPAPTSESTSPRELWKPPSK